MSDQTRRASACCSLVRGDESDHLRAERHHKRANTMATGA